MGKGILVLSVIRYYDSMAIILIRFGNPLIQKITRGFLKITGK
jgi:hypothetical protein